MSHDTVFIGGVFPHVSLPMFSLEIHCREVSNVEASQLKERVNWKASRATSGAAYFCEVRISGSVDQVGNLELSWCRPGGTQ